MQVHRYSPTDLTAMLGFDHMDFADPATQSAVLSLADKLAPTWGDDTAAEQAARAAGFHPILAYDERWNLEQSAVVDDPVNEAIVFTRQRWDILRRMAEGWPTSAALAVAPDAWCERTMQRFRNENMTRSPSRYEAYQYEQDDHWLWVCDAADDDPVGAALQHGLVRNQDLPDGHPARVAVAEQARMRRIMADRSRRAAASAARAQQSAQLAFAV